MGADGLPALDLKSLPGADDTLRKEFSNGLVFLARENFSSPSVVISGYVEVGSLDESPEQAGLAALTASALLRGTQRRSFNQIYEQLESIGASLQLSAGKHHTSFWGKALAEDLGVLLELLAEVLQQPRFERAQVERLRAEKLTALAIRDHDTGSRAIMAFNELVYRKHPYGVSTDGYKDTVPGLTPAALRSFHRQHYGPQGMLLCVVGGVRGAQRGPPGRAAAGRLAVGAPPGHAGASAAGARQAPQAQACAAGREEPVRLGDGRGRAVRGRIRPIWRRCWATTSWGALGWRGASATRCASGPGWPTTPTARWSAGWDPDPGR